MFLSRYIIGVKNGKVIGDLKGLTPAEREFVDELVSQGKQVELIPRGSGKTADFLIDGVETELKTVNRLGTNTVKNAIQSASKQGENILIDARGTSLTKADALNQINRAQGNVGGLEGRVTILTGEGSVNF